MEPTIVESRYRHSADLGELFSALAIAQGEMGHAAKDSVNPHFRSKYADLASAVDAARAALAKNGLAVLQPPCSVGGNEVTVVTVIGHKSGQWWLSELKLTAQDSKPQSVGSAITYGRRYGFMGMLGMASDDDDGNSASGREPRESQAAVAERRIAEERTKAEPPVEPKEDRFKKMIGAFAQVKQDLFIATGNHDAYYRVMGTHGLEHANQAKDMKTAQAVYKELTAELNDARLKEPVV